MFEAKLFLLHAIHKIVMKMASADAEIGRVCETERVAPAPLTIMAVPVGTKRVTANGNVGRKRDPSIPPHGIHVDAHAAAA